MITCRQAYMNSEVEFSRHGVVVHLAMTYAQEERKQRQDAGTLGLVNFIFSTNKGGRTL